MGELDGAVVIFQECLSEQETYFGHDHDKTLRTRSALANALFNRGDYVRAEALFGQCLAAQSRSKSDSEPSTKEFFSKDF